MLHSDDLEVIPVGDRGRLDPTAWEASLDGAVPSLVKDDAVVLTGSAGLQACSADSGQTVWKRAYQGGVESPPVPDEGGEKLLFCSQDRALVAVDQDDGHELWRFGVKTRGSQPVAAPGGGAYVQRGTDICLVDAQGRQVRRHKMGDMGIRIAGLDDRGNAVVVSKSQTFIRSVGEGRKKNWEYPCGRAVVGPDGLILAVSAACHVTRLAPDDGSEVWRRDAALFTEVQVSAQGQVFIHDGKTFDRVDPADGHNLWSLPADALRLLEVVGDRALTVKNGETLVALDLESGAIAWELPEANRLVGMFEDRSGLLYLASGDRLAVHDPESGDKLREWKFPAGLAGVSYEPRTHRALAVEKSGRLRAITCQTPAELAAERAARPEQRFLEADPEWVTVDSFSVPVNQE